MPTRLRSFCKINLGLAVGPLRPDGFHALTTVYQTLALHDLVTVRVKPANITRITLAADHPFVPCTAKGNAERNTAFRMVQGALHRLHLTAEVHLALEKRLPVQGGLGAGSANAAAALLALEHELQTALPGHVLSGPDRLALAAEIGSDVPLFLLGGTVLGLDRGEAVFPLPDSPPLPVVVAVPTVGVSTAQAFRDLDARAAAPLPPPPGLTSPAPTDRLEQLSRVLASVWTPNGQHIASKRVPTGIADLPGASSRSDSDLAESPASPDPSWTGTVNPLLALVRTGVENDFEDVAFRQHPSLRDIKRALEGATASGTSAALYAALSGSGSALFGIYADPEAARAAQQRVQALGTRALLTETLPRSAYWRQMFA